MLRPACVFFLILVAGVRANMEGYIVGGNYADIEYHSHSAYLNVNCEVSGVKIGWICGASVVNQRILLTAAHCLDECNRESHISINLGDNHKERGQSCTTYGFLIHEDYNAETSANDLGLVKTSGVLILGKTIRRVALMRRPPYSEKATIAGWGITDEYKNTGTNLLKYVPQKVWSRDQCLNVFGEMPRGSFCAASPDRMDEYPAVGDSGCGLLVRGYIQLGLVSYKTPSHHRHVVVYTDVGFYYDWIKSNARRLFCFKK